MEDSDSARTRGANQQCWRKNESAWLYFAEQLAVWKITIHKFSNLVKFQETRSRTEAPLWCGS